MRKLHLRRAMAMAVALSAGLVAASACSSDGVTTPGSDSVASRGSATSSPAAEVGEPSDSPTPSASSDGGAAAAGQPATPTPAPGLPTLSRGRVQTDVLARLPGSPGKACVAVGTARDVRSGGFGAGPFDDARASAGSGDLRLYFIPEHAKSLPGVVVTGRNAATGETFRQRQRIAADADQFHFYDLQLPASTGTWQIRAISGVDSGCWTVDLG